MIRRLFCALFLSALIALPTCAQQAPTATQEFAFEAVSIHAATDMGMSIGGGPPNRYSAHNVSLWDLMYNAYPVRPHSDVPGLPSWARSARFSIDAVMDEATFAALRKLPNQEATQKYHSMLQKMLADTFKLKLHTETRELPLYALVIDKGGPKLKPASDDGMDGGSSRSNRQIKISSSKIEKLAFVLADTLGREVVDRTGLTGTYDIELHWTPDQDQGQPDAGPTLPAALKEQLGLKLEATKGPVTVYVVDHAEKPEVN